MRLFHGSTGRLSRSGPMRRPPVDIERLEPRLVLSGGLTSIPRSIRTARRPGMLPPADSASAMVFLKSWQSCQMTIYWPGGSSGAI